MQEPQTEKEEPTRKIDRMLILCDRDPGPGEPTGQLIGLVLEKVNSESVDG